MSSAHRPRILVVEDDADLREAYVMILKSKDYDVSEASDGQVALDLIAKNGDPDLILLDLRMPGMDGIEFLVNYQPKRSEETQIVVFSNYDSEKEIDQAFEHGATKYILKARSSPSELIKIVEELL